MPTRKQPISAEDLYRFELITDCQISPDGRHVVYPIRRIERKMEKRYANLWLVPTDGGPARQFTYGNQVDSQPRWSPDGNQIAFLSNRDDEKQPQLYLIPTQGGEARRLTDLKGEIAMFAWSPTGKQLVCQVRKKDPETIARGADEQKKKLGVVARRITRIWYKFDGSGYLPNERWHIWTIDAGSGKAKQLTASDVHADLAPCWSPDGQWIAFCSNRSTDPDLKPEAVDLLVMSAKGGDCRALATPTGSKFSPQFSPDGRWLAYYSIEGRDLGWKNMGLWVAPVDGSSEARSLTAPFDFLVFNLTLNDLYGFLPTPPPVWASDGRKLYFPVCHHGNMFIKAIGLDGELGSLESIVDAQGVVGTFSFDQAQTTLAYFYADLREPGQVWVRTMADKRSRRVTQLNANLLRNRDLGEVEALCLPGTEGQALHGWILKPPGFDPAHTYPAILEIHGGPYAQYGNFFMHEFYYLAAQGYVVYFCNPRGSLGYGEDHARAVDNNWGSPAFDDLMVWTDYVQQLPYVDPHRLGVTGGSYGGYMTNWMIGHTDRFKAAVTKRSISNLVSLCGASDANWWFQRAFGDALPWEKLENYWQLSPLKYIGQAKTPTLVIHCEQDLRCPIDQGEQLFVALKQLGVATELILFPDEAHGMSAGGRTDRRIAQLQHTLRWFDRYLKLEESPPHP